MKKITLYLFTILGLSIVMSSCEYNQFDNPPTDEPITDMVATHTIAQLKNMYAPGGTLINEDIIISGKVISSDREGNVARALIIQDNTGGIEIKIASYSLYNYYKQGMIVYLKCKGLKLGAYGGTISIGATTPDTNYENDFIPFPVKDNYLFRGITESPVAPRLLTIPTLSQQYSNTLIKLENVQFLASELELTYADPVNKKTENRTLTDINNNRFIVRTSGYARFAGDVIAQGSGEIVGILTYFNTTAQLTIISLNDVKLDNPRF